MASVAAHELGAGARLAVLDARRRQDRVDPRPVEVLVLRREGVDRRGHDLHPVQPRPGIGLPREHRDLGHGHVRKEELPPAPGHVVRVVHADVAAPHHGGAGLGHGRDQSRRLGVVHDDHVPATDRLRQLVRVGPEHTLVDLPLLRTERPAVALVSVEPVVDPLGEGEEVFVPFDHRPPGVDPHPGQVAHHRAEQLGHAATLGSGVHAPQDAVAEAVDRFLHRTGESPVAVGAEHPLEPLRLQGRDLDRLHASLRSGAPGRSLRGCFPAGASVRTCSSGRRGDHRRRSVTRRTLRGLAPRAP